jgi:very-short-patch-repair endonuclease
VVGFWVDLPMGHAVWLDGVSAETLALALDPLPAGAPVVVTYHPEAHLEVRTAASAILGNLDQVAAGLYPTWLPGAEAIDHAAGLGSAAVRSLARRVAAETGQYGPFLSDLADQCLQGRGVTTVKYLDGVRAVGLARVIGASYGRREMAFLVVVPERFSDETTEALVAACGRLASQGGLGAWLVGSIRPVDGGISVVRVHVDLPGFDLYGTREVSPQRPGVPSVGWPPVAGRPHPGSAAEQALEVALAAQPWAAGRAWNQTCQVAPLANPMRLDLLWAAERCVVEVDGPEHCSPLHYDADRRRDVDLQLAGYVVLRFTNAQVMSDVSDVVSRIGRFLTVRRTTV